MKKRTSSKNIQNRRVVSRLSQYKGILYKFKDLGLSRIFSSNIAEALYLNPSQVRKDFSLFKIFGNKRGGYNIDTLLSELKNLLGKNETTSVIIVGVGNIGQALSKYRNFERDKIDIVAMFDIDPIKHNIEAKPPVFPIDIMEDYINKNHIKVAILAVPGQAAHYIFDLLVSVGIQGILNFAPIQLKTVDTCIVNNVNLGVELETIIYFVNNLSKQTNI